MLDDILEEFSPKEVITIVIERRWKYRNPTKIVKQLWEIPVLVIRNTGKAILVTKEGGSSWADGKKGEAIWLPSFAMSPTGDRTYKVRYDKIDGDDFTRFVKKYGYKPVKELEESFTMKSFSEFLEEKALYGDDFISAFEKKIIEKYNGKHTKTEQDVVVKDPHFYDVVVKAQRDVYEVPIRGCVITFYLYSKFKHSDNKYSHRKKHCSVVFDSIKYNNKVEKFNAPNEYNCYGYDSSTIKDIDSTLRTFNNEKIHYTVEEAIKALKKGQEMRYQYLRKHATLSML